MITIIYDEKGKDMSLQASGHAGYAPKGQAYRPNSALLFGNCPQTQKSPGAGQTPSVKPCGFATSLSEGGNPLSHRCAMPAPPRGGAYLLQTVRCLKAPPFGGAGTP